MVLKSDLNPIYLDGCLILSGFGVELFDELILALEGCGKRISRNSLAFIVYKIAVCYIFVIFSLHIGYFIGCTVCIGGKAYRREDA